MNKFFGIVILGVLLAQEVMMEGTHRGGRRNSFNRRGRQDSQPIGSSYGVDSDYSDISSSYGSPSDSQQPAYGNGLDTAPISAEDEAGDPLAMLEKSVPGVPGEDYPIYSEVPDTGFACDGQVDGGYYADPEAECQVFHICTADGAGGLAKYSFLCPNGTIFNQNYFICDWWFNFDCAEAEGLYSKNEEIAAEREAISAEQGSSTGYDSPTFEAVEAQSEYGVGAVEDEPAPLDIYYSPEQDPTRSGRSRFNQGRRQGRRNGRKNGRKFRN